MLPALLPLAAPTPSGWAAVALKDFDAFLKDHASCERKAAASAMGFVAIHGERPEIIEPMVTLAREELDHFIKVYRLILKRGQTLAPDGKDPYVNGLLAAMRQDPRDRLLDRLVVSCLIEARSAERLHLVSVALEDVELKDFYATLARSEAGHFRVFLRIAERLFPAADVAASLERLAAHEQKVMEATPWRCAVH